MRETAHYILKVIDRGVAFHLVAEKARTAVHRRTAVSIGGLLDDCRDIAAEMVQALVVAGEAATLEDTSDAWDALEEATRSAEVVVGDLASLRARVDLLVLMNEVDV